MINQYDILYGLGVSLSAPYWLIKAGTRRKVLRAFSGRMGHVAAREGDQPAILIHAVSLGEINATRSVIDLLRRDKPGLQFIVSVTTETGYARGLEIYKPGSGVTLVRYPLDFTPAVDRLLDNLRPTLVVLMELEVWPNFIKRCQGRGIPVILVNGRVTTGSFPKYKFAKPLIGTMFRRLTRVCAQDEVYARRFIALGAIPDRVSVTGTMKFDTAAVADTVPGTDELAKMLGLRPGQERIWVCGSTGPGEEALILHQYRLLLNRFADLRLVIVPRKPERFDEVADLIRAAQFQVLRWSNPMQDVEPAMNSVVLIDTIGQLRKAYAMADVVFVGRTLVDLGSRQHGSDMIEPAALAKPTVVGPFTGNFAEPMMKFIAADAMKVIRSAQELGAVIGQLLASPAEAGAMGRRAREVVKQEQGATARNAEVILQILHSKVSDA